MSEPFLKVFSDFLDRADARFKSMRDEVRNELLLVIRSEMPAPVPGPQGERGERGLDGRDGAGVQGPQGERGEKGMDGAPGTRGEKGEPGERGDLGPQGERGLPGEVGPRGEQGDKGEPGERGPAGPQGERGPQGEKGLDGAPGPIGPQGEKGLPGETGQRGEKGLDGVNGRDGRDGIKGDSGRDGKDGISMLEVEAAAQRIALKMLSEVKLVGRSLTIGENTVHLPIPVYKGVWRSDSTYEGGDMATWDGSLWHANAATTTKPGEGSEDWTLVAKRGRNAANPVKIEP